MTRKLTVSAIIAFSVLLAGCATYPSGYHDPPGTRNDGYGNSYTRQSSVCQSCGVVVDSERVQLHGSTSGLGAFIGAIAGGVLGSTVGNGDGRTAATVAGAVAGGVAGNAIERNSDGGGGDAWRFQVRLDDGRQATVTQYNNPGFRRGDRVVIRNNRLEWSRR